MISVTELWKLEKSDQLTALFGFIVLFSLLIISSFIIVKDDLSFVQFVLLNSILIILLLIYVYLTAPYFYLLSKLEKNYSEKNYLKNIHLINSINNNKVMVVKAFDDKVLIFRNGQPICAMR